jgi:hypothetical protein
VDVDVIYEGLIEGWFLVMIRASAMGDLPEKYDSYWNCGIREGKQQGGPSEECENQVECENRTN